MLTACEMFKTNRINFIAFPTDNAYLQEASWRLVQANFLKKISKIRSMTQGIDQVKEIDKYLGQLIHLRHVASYEELETAFDLIPFNEAKTES